MTARHCPPGRAPRRSAGWCGDGRPARRAKPAAPRDVADTGNHALRRIGLSGVVTTVARRGLTRPTDVVVLEDGSYAVADPGRHVVVQVTADGRVERLAGTGTAGFRGDGGPADAARLRGPSAVATSPAGLLIADTGNAVVRRIDDDGTITTIAGAVRGGSASGAWVRAPLRFARGVAATSAGDVVVADGGRVWLVGTDGAVRVLAGAARPGFDGDGSDPPATRLSGVAGLATAPGDVVIAADGGNDRIRSVSPTGTLTTVAGSDRPDVRLAPVALAPFRRARPQTTPIGRPYYHGGGGGIRANVLKLRPYSEPSIRSAAVPVLLELGTSIDVHLTGFARAAAATSGGWRSTPRRACARSACAVGSSPGATGPSSSAAPTTARARATPAGCA